MRAGPVGSARILFARAILAVAALALTPLTRSLSRQSPEPQAGQLAGRDNAAIDEFYRARGGRPLWFTGSVRRQSRRAARRLARSRGSGRPRSARLSIAVADARNARRLGRIAARGGAGRSSAVASLRRLCPRPAQQRVERHDFHRPRAQAVGSRRRAKSSRRRRPRRRSTPISPRWAGCIRSTARSAAHSPCRAAHFGRGQLAQMVRINLERARALPVDFGQRYIVVDAAAARLYMYENGRVHDSMKIVVGKASDPTPMMAALMRHAIVNPYWNVPDDLVGERIAPQVLSEGMSYLSAKRYQVLIGLGPQSHGDRPDDDRLAGGQGRHDAGSRPPAARTGQCDGQGEVRISQSAGDLPARHQRPRIVRRCGAAVQRRLRAAGGCAAAGQMALRQAVDVAKSSKPEQKIPLATPVPVYITYLTVGAENGRLAYRQDVYNRDAARLASSRRCGERGQLPAIQAPGVDVVVTSAIARPCASRAGR